MNAYNRLESLWDEDSAEEVDYRIKHEIARYFLRDDKPVEPKVEYRMLDDVSQNWILSCIYSIEVDSYIYQVDNSSNTIDGFYNYNWIPISFFLYTMGTFNFKNNEVE